MAAQPPPLEAFAEVSLQTVLDSLAGAQIEKVRVDGLDLFWHLKDGRVLMATVVGGGGVIALATVHTGTLQ